MALRGLLLDLEGVLYQEDAAIPGAVEAVQVLQGRGLALRGLTNTTTRPRREIADRLARLGIPLGAEALFTPPVAAARALEAEGLRRLHLAAAPALALDFAGFELVDERPEAVVLGDLYLDFTWERLNRLFGFLRDGARLIALHKNRVSRRGAEIALDLGPFVAALEYASGREALVVGKPARAFFELALADLGLAAGAVAMVGDDIEADIGGALSAGLAAVQVRTGKYRPQDDTHPTIRPSGRIESIVDLPAWVSGSPQAIPIDPDLL